MATVRSGAPKVRAYGCPASLPAKPMAAVVRAILARRRTLRPRATIWYRLSARLQARTPPVMCWSRGPRCAASRKAGQGATAPLPSAHRRARATSRARWCATVSLCAGTDTGESIAATKLVRSGHAWHPVLEGRPMNFRLLPVAVFPLAVTASMALAHPGRTAADGCHNDRKNGGRHCHGGSVRNAPPAASPQRLSDNVWFPNCAAARAAGAAPVRRGSPGYGRHLDRDGDGIGCE